MLEHLASLGFTNAAVLAQTDTVVTVRVRTSKGWVYEKFPAGNLDAVTAWAARHSPETPS